ncbi:MAG: DUF411 domain-containing protein [Gemmatimonadota bacterium]
MDRRTFLGQTLTAGALAALASIVGAAQPKLPTVTVYKGASCGCCKAWIEHLTRNGFTVKGVDTDDLSGVKLTMGVPAALESCHTAVVGVYLVEGHVPAADIKRMLTQRPAIRGIAVPGMPIGSPGMEQGNPKDYGRYAVIAFAANGTTSVFARY